MKPMNSKITGTMLSINKSSAGGGGGPDVMNWEIRPGGMLVQKRNSDSNPSSAPIPTIRVRVKCGSSFHEININSQASFGELKKMLAEPTGLHTQDQKLIFKGKVRDSKAYLDVAGVKDGSKLVLVEDLVSRERRCLELRRNATMEKASKAIVEIRLEVDKLADQVSALELAVSSGGKVMEKDMVNLTELLMMKLIKLDGIISDGDLKLQRRVQVRRVQKYIETLDSLKIQNSMLNKNGDSVPLQQREMHSSGQMPIPLQQQQEQHKQRNSVAQTRVMQQPLRHPGPDPVVVTTKWETFDSSMEPMPITFAFRPNSTTTNPNAKLNWEFFE
ncbi:hypothetical protein L1049_006959 [Liquidambar formosana]|uniref:BAG family molecular chaperone regulator 1 n=1 Tax=Liquidambar formosana TaxID=63359 RepID=A0AAP0RGE2_LIQFO